MLNVKYGRIMDAKIGLLERIYGDSDLVNCNLAEVRVRGSINNNRKYMINNSVVVRLGDDDASEEEAENTRFSMSETKKQNTVLVSTTKNRR